MIITIPATTTHIGTQLSQLYSYEMARNLKKLFKILSCIKFLTRHSLPLRGHDDSGDSNFIQLLKHRAKQDWELHEYFF